MIRSRFTFTLSRAAAAHRPRWPVGQRACSPNRQHSLRGRRAAVAPDPAQGGLFVTERLEAPAPVATTADQGDRILFEAETVSRADETSPIIAEGNVRAYFGERYLRADRLSMIRRRTSSSPGNVSITDRSLETAFAGRVELTGDLRDGIAENFSALLADNARLASQSAVREQGARTRLKNAVYTSCNVCDDEGEGKTPTWRIKSLRVTRDEERKVVRFHHAFFEIKGVPVLYAPFLQAPDPSVERQSGFLTPLIGASSRLGFNLELPYYLAISNSQDATFSPKYTSKDGMLWQGEYRRRDENGYQVLQGGLIDFDPDTLNPNADVPGVRWHIFAKGYRDFGDKWQVGYDVERVSDDTYLRRYDVQRRGDLRKELDTSQTNRLRTNTYVRYGSGPTSFSANTYLFQGLRSTDVAELTPYVLPILDFRHEFTPPAIGGDADVNLNFASLQRTSGADTRRITGSVYWEREEFTAGGHRFKGFAELRADGYHYSDLNEGTELCSDPTNSCSALFPWINRTDPTDFDARFVPTVGLEWSYPLVRRAGASRLFIEPRVQLVASPSDRNDNSFINEDSQSIEFDYAGLFDYNKSTGYDAFEDGQRMNIGIAASAQFDNGIAIEGQIGQQFRLQASEAFDLSTGLGETQSDYVGSLNIKYKNVVGVENRFRIDDANGSIRRAESMMYFNYWRLRGNASYVRLNEEILAGFNRKREELNARMNVKLSKHWSTGVGWREDLALDRTIRQDFIIGYEDECSLFELTYRRDRTNEANRDLPADNAFLVRFTLRSLVE
ncbi:MAG: LPS assembly protein LptD [Parvularculaceae bacterium]